jgi:hypothetical protein
VTQRWFDEQAEKLAYWNFEVQQPTVTRRFLKGILREAGLDVSGINAEVE